MKRTKEATEDLRKVSRVKKRARVERLLATKPRTVSELATRLECTPRTILLILKELDEGKSPRLLVKSGPRGLEAYRFI